MSDEKKILKDLDPKYFQHPLDMAATNNLAKVRGMNLFTKKFMELGFEKIFLIQNLGSCLRVSETQIPSIWKVYKEACDVLEVDPPDLRARSQRTRRTLRSITPASRARR